MPWVVFEPTILAFKRANTIHALDRAAPVISRQLVVTATVILKVQVEGLVADTGEMRMRTNLAWNTGEHLKDKA
jgi:hypothetical protein